MPIPLIVLSLKSTLLRALSSSSVKATIWSEVKASSTIDLIRPLSLLRFALSSVIGELVLLDCVIVTVVSTSECVDEELTTSEVAVLVSVSLANAMNTVLFSVVVVATDDAVSVT